MKRISRRNFLKVAGVGAAALGLAACGGSSSSTASSTASSAAASAAPAEDVTIKVAAIETGYGADMWKKVTEAFTAQTGIKVELTTDKKLEDVIGPSMQGGDYPDVVHLATGREAALTEQFIKGNLIADITDVLSMTVPGESKKANPEYLLRGNRLAFASGISPIAAFKSLNINRATSERFEAGICKPSNVAFPSQKSSIIGISPKRVSK